MIVYYCTKCGKCFKRAESVNKPVLCCGIHPLSCACECKGPKCQCEEKLIAFWEFVCGSSWGKTLCNLVISEIADNPDIDVDYITPKAWAALTRAVAKGLDRRYPEKLDIVIADIECELSGKNILFKIHGALGSVQILVDQEGKIALKAMTTKDWHFISGIKSFSILPDIMERS